MERLDRLDRLDSYVHLISICESEWDYLSNLSTLSSKSCFFTKKFAQSAKKFAQSTKSQKITKNKSSHNPQKFSKNTLKSKNSTADKVSTNWFSITSFSLSSPVTSLDTVAIHRACPCLRVLGGTSFPSHPPEINKYIKFI